MTVNEQKLPKILVVGQSFNHTTGGGVTVSNLFANWEKSKIFSLHLGKEPIDFEVCENVYVSGYRERTLRIFRPFVRLKNASMILTGKPEEKRSEEKYLKPSTPSNISKSRRIILKIITFFGVNHLLRHFKLSQQLKVWLDDIKPEVLYAQYSDYASMHFIIQLHKYLHIPLIVHIMDNWISIPPITSTQRKINENPLTRFYWQYKSKVLFMQLLNRASARIAISEAMAIEYQRRYNLPFSWAHNYIKEEEWEDFKNNAEKKKQELIIGYFGTIDIKNVETFNYLFEALSLIKDYKIKVHIFSSGQLTETFSKFENVAVFDTVNQNEYKKEILKCSILYLPLGFSEQSINYTQFSMPTKFSEYLVSEIPVLVFAHQDTALYKFCKKNQCAILVPEKSVEKLKNAIIEIVENELLTEQITKNGYITATTLLSKQSMLDRFQNEFLNLHK